MDERRSPSHFLHPKLTTLNNNLALYNFTCPRDQSFNYPFYQPLSLTVRIMIFKCTGRRHFITTVILSRSAQVALDDSCDENGCMFVRLPAILESLGDMSGVIWPLIGGTDCAIHTEQITIISRTGE